MRRLLVQEMLTKTRAITEAMEETGFGRRVIENKMTELEAKGIIRIIPSTADRRLMLISRAHLDLVIRSLKGEYVT